MDGSLQVSRPEDEMGLDGVKVPIQRVVITFSPLHGLNIQVPDDPIMACGLLDMARAVVYQKLNVKQSPIVRPG
jgi:hypothetical protein